MVMGTLIIEGIVNCFIVLICCVVGIANGPVGLVCFYEKEVWQRVIEMGLTTEKKIKHNAMLFRIFGIIPMLAFSLAAVYGINGARGFLAGFGQLVFIFLCEGLFDRLFIDYWWVGKTKAWVIKGTEDLQPYIYGKTLIGKWLMTLVGYPIIAAILAGIMDLIIKA